MTTTELPDVTNFGGNGTAITVDDLLERGKLFTLDQGLEVLASTEPLAFVDMTTGPHIRWRVEENFANDIEEIHGTEAVPIFVKIQHGLNDGVEYQVSADAFAEALKQFGLGYKYAIKCPNYLVEDHLNYWYRTGLDNRDLRAMLVGDSQLVAALTRATVNPFSNLQLVDRAVDKIQARYPGATIYFDASKMAHSLRQTYTQLIIPELTRLMTATGEVNDVWWGGVQLKNSLVGESQTGVEGFLLRWLCTNGMIDTGPSAAGWSRKSGGQDPEDVYAWAEEAVESVLGGLEGAFDAVQSLTDERIDGDVALTIGDVFGEHRIPGPLQHGVLDGLVENDDLTMYGLMNAITAAANGDVTPQHQQLLMRTGGSVSRHKERCGQCRRLLPECAQSDDHAGHSH